MERLISLFFILIITGCGVDEPLYDYDVEEKIKKLNIELPTPGEPIANYVPTVRFSETKN